MNIFACTIDLAARPVEGSFRRSIESSPFVRDAALCWHAGPGFLGAVVEASGATTAFAHAAGALAVGTARIDNRTEVGRELDLDVSLYSDLELALRFVLLDDGTKVRRLLGDFAFVAWNPAARALLAVRDVFGVRKLFHAGPHGGVMQFASHASLVSSGESFDDRYLVERLSQCGSDPTRTAYVDVSALPPAGVLRIQDGVRSFATIWSPREAQESRSTIATDREWCEAFRALFIESVRCRLPEADATWSHLSGGLDSSSVVSTVQWLVARGEVGTGLAGTITYTDSLGTSADERAFSNAVVRQYGLRNELVPHHVDATEFATDPPLLDQPDLPIAMALRDRAAARAIRRAGGRVLLTGEAGDSLVTGTMFFFADWLVSGRARAALREMAHRSALGRVSFWKLAYENAALPLLPSSVRALLMRRRATSIPPWIPSRVARRLELRSRSSHEPLYRGRIGHKYEDAASCTIGTVAACLPLGPQAEMLDVRHPFLHRPLVELALRLPPELCVRPHARKWVLREAMRGVLPEVVRTRVGKGALDGLNAWSLVHHGKRADRLLAEPMLGDLGCVDPVILRRILQELRSGDSRSAVWRDLLNSTLDVELWLQLRSGRWAATDAQCTTQESPAGRTTPSTGQLSRSII
jgi:asparagine synthase (glutamine-hydrolysing)